MSEVRQSSHTCPNCGAAVSEVVLTCNSCDAVFAGQDSRRSAPRRDPTRLTNAEEGAAGTMALQVWVFMVYGFANLFFMMWVGFGGAGRLMSILGNLAFCLYPVLCILAIYVPLNKASIAVRNTARYAVCAPWGLILVIALPQTVGNVDSVVMFVLVAVAVWYLRISGEALVRWLARPAKRARPGSLL